MIRVMGDSVGTNSNLIPRSVDLVAGYVTGLPPVPWFDRDWNEFPGIPHVTIDQGAGNSPRYDADVIDIETGAWDVTHVTGWMNNATASRPTVYVNQGNEWGACLAALASARFRGDVWLAFPGWQPGQPLPGLPSGCRYVAVQNQLSVNGVYDLSAVIDDGWHPAEGVMILKILSIDRATVPAGVNWPGDWLLDGLGHISHIQTMLELVALQNAGIPQTTISYVDWQALAGVQ